MKKLVIAEKPSLARKIIDGLKTTGENFKNEGEFYSSNNYYVTSVFGHIFELRDISDYKCNAEKNMWQLSNLPFFPNNYEYVLKKDTSKRYKAIKELVNSSDVNEIIHCGDPDREGQVIVDIVLEQLRCNKKVTRPLLKATTPSAIVEEFNQRKENDDYVNWRKEGLVRSYVDNDYGKNLSRYATVKTNSKPALNVGRVIGAIITEIYNRDMAIKNFLPEKFFKVESELDGLKLTSKEKFDKSMSDQASTYADKLNNDTLTVQSIEKKEVIINSPKLFSQTDLQGYLNKHYGFSPDKTLSLSQTLYEKGYSSYPRTNTQFIAEDEKDGVKKIIKAINTDEIEFKDTKKVFDNSKIEGHSAITPTDVIPDITKLAEDEKVCYLAILNRFKAVFCRENCIVAKTEMNISCSLETFKVVGESPVKEGWKKFEKVEEKEKLLPLFSQGDIVPTAFKSIEAETVPPKHYTVDTLGKWMRNPLKKEDATDEDEYKNILAGLEIGTEATRAGILQKAKDKEYISLKKTTYNIEPRGIFLVECCSQLGIDMSKEKTAQMGKYTKDVYKGNKTINEVLTLVRNEISMIINTDCSVKQDTANEKPNIGLCPICGKPIYENQKAFGCSGWKDGCKFVIWKTIAGKKITVKQATDLLAGKSVGPIKGFKSKAGKSFDAKIALSDNKVVFDFGEK